MRTGFHRIHILWSLILLCAVVIGLAGPVQAQSGGLSILLNTPAEQETFYAGPSSLVYSIDIRGVIAGVKGDPTVLPVRLEIVQGDRVATTLQTQPSADGSFEFSATVNPEGSDPSFTIDMQTRFCSFVGINNQCHYRTAYSLPRGQVLLRVRAQIPGGKEAIVERHIIVDRSAYMTLPIKVVLADHPEQPVVNVPVLGSTWLYMWRERSAAGTTGPDGIALVNKVEALAQAPTHYVFRVEPSVVDGVLYESVEPVNVTLPPGATSAPGVTLRVRKSVGQISGKISGASLPNLPVRAIRLPEGAPFSTTADWGGTFMFANLPVARYLLSAESALAERQGYAGKPETVDLTRDATSVVTLTLAPRTDNAVSGTIRDGQDKRLPFAWVDIERAATMASAEPGSGAYKLRVVPRQALTLVASAPGFYSQAQAVAAAGENTIDFTLSRRPETATLAWGNGEVIAPPESHVEVMPGSIRLDYGWLWGQGGEGLFEIQLPNETIVVQSGEFALEYFPERAMWLYVVEGSATIRTTRMDAAVEAHTAQMVNLADPARLVPVPLDASVTAALSPLRRSPVDYVWESNPIALVRNWLAQMGIGLAQVTTFVTYCIVLAAFVLTPLWLIIGWLKQKKSS